MLCSKWAFIAILFYHKMLLSVLATERITYLHVERPKLNFINPKYYSKINFTTKRYGRRNPVYYVDLEFNQLVYFGNNLTVDFYFYQFLSNRYHRSFVEMHFGWCKLIHEDPFFGSAMKQGSLAGPCPYPPGDYHMYNMTVPPAAIPLGFPFQKGRIYANFTLDKNEDVVRGHIDMEIKELKSGTKFTKLFRV